MPLPRRILLTLAMGVLVFAFLRVALVALLGVVWGEGGTDWVSFYSAGTMVRTGHADDLYDLTAQAATQTRLFGPQEHENAFPLPAFVAYALAPLSALSFRVTYLILLAMNLCVIAGLAVAAARYLRPSMQAPIRRYYVAAAAFAVPVTMALFLGQADLIVLAAMLGAFGLIARGQAWVAGPMLALALIKPQFALSAAALLLVRRDWRTLGTFSAAAAVLLIFPVIIESPALFSDQLSLFGSYQESSTEHSVNARMMVNLRGTVTSIYESAPIWTWAPPLFAVAAGGLAVAVRRWSVLPSTHPQAVAMALVLPLIASPHVHFHSLVFLLAAATLYVAAHAQTGGEVKLTRVAMAHLGVTVLWLASSVTVGLVSLVVIAAFGAMAFAWPQVSPAASFVVVTRWPGREAPALVPASASALLGK